MKYELGKPRYGPDECRQLRLTYGRPFRVWLRLNKEQPRRGRSLPRRHADHDRRRRVHHQRGRARRRQPAPPLARRRLTSSKPKRGDRKLHSCRIIPERGSWIEINVTKKDTFGVRIDQSGKFSAMTLLRAMDPAYSTDEPDHPGVLSDRRRIERSRRPIATAIEGHAAPSATSSIRRRAKSTSKPARPFTRERVDKIYDVARSRRSRSCRQDRRRQPIDMVILNSFKEDPTDTHEEALLKIYQRLRPGNPPQLEKAKELFKEKFQDPNRYRLGRVGRFRINRKFNQDVPETRDDAAGGRLPQRGPLHPRSAGQRQGHRRRHRPPRQSPSADDRRAGRRRTAQGLPEAAPHRAGAHGDPRSAGHDAALAHQPEEHLGGDRVLLRSRRTVARSSTRRIRSRN